MEINTDVLFILSNWSSSTSSYSESYSSLDSSSVVLTDSLISNSFSVLLIWFCWKSFADDNDFWSDVEIDFDWSNIKKMKMIWL